MSVDDDRVSFLGRRCPEGLRLRTVVLQPGDAVDYVPADWVGTAVVLERGELEIQCCSGARARFAEGAILVLSGLPLRRLVNAGGTTLVLTALSRDRSIG